MEGKPGHTDIITGTSKHQPKHTDSPKTMIDQLTIKNGPFPAFCLKFMYNTISVNSLNV
jgi:hypothetical protein